MLSIPAIKQFLELTAWHTFDGSSRFFIKLI